MYYPLVASFCAEGTYESTRLHEGFVHAVLRRGNAPGAAGAVRFIRETIRKSRGLAVHLDARIDAGLVDGRTLDAFDNEGVRVVGRLKSNARLDRLAGPYLSRPPGRPTKDGDEFAIEVGTYQADSWSRPYRLVLVVIDLPDPKTGLGEFNGCVGNGLSAGAFEANETALLLKLLAFNLPGVVRGELEDASGNGWDLKRVQQTVLKTGARVVVPVHALGDLLTQASRRSPLPPVGW